MLLGLRLRRALAEGQGRPLRPEAPDPAFLRRAEVLRQRCLELHRGRGAPGGLVLLCSPDSLAGEVWAADLEAGLRHLGRPVHRLPPHQEPDEELLERLRPALVLALDRLSDPAWAALLRWRGREEGLLLALPTRDDLLAGPRAHRGPEARRLARLLQAHEQRRLDGAWSLYEPSVYDWAHPELAAAGLPYLPLRQAANPIEDRPVPQDRRWGSLFMSAANPARRAVSAELLPLLRLAPCRWIGQGWGFGEQTLPPAEVPAALGSARIVLSPLIAAARRSPLELTHRVYEAAACGAFQLCSWSPLARSAFSRRALVLAADGAELLALYRSYLHREDERLRIAEAALEEALASHTVFHRAALLLGWAAARAGGEVWRASRAG